MDSLDAVGGALGEFLYKNAAVMLPTLGAAAASYLTGRFGRKVKLRVGDLELEASTIKQLEEMLVLVAKYRDSQKGESEDPEQAKPE